MSEQISIGASHSRSGRSSGLQRAPLGASLQETLQESRKSIYQLSADSGIDGAYIWRIMRGERTEVSREVLLLISIALVLDKSLVDQVVEMANRLLDAGGYKALRG